MAERRMFAKTIIDSDAFLDMPMSTQCLYFHMAMRADDDGFVNNPKKIQRMIGCNDDDIKLLILKKFIIPFESGVVVIKHWKIHNYIRNDRYKETTYKDEKSCLKLDENNAYTLGIPCGIPNGYQMDTQDRIGKVRLGKDSKDIHAQSDTIACEPVITITLNGKSEYPIYQHMIDEWIELYPNVDIMQELRNMKGWCSANPERRKTKRGILRFIVGWLSREQDKPKVNKKVPEWFNQTSDESVKDVDDAEIENMQRLLGGKK